MVEDKEQYVKDGINHLSDETIYERVNTDPTKPLAEAINTYVEDMYQEGAIDVLTKEHLTLKTEPPPRTQQLYFLKKILHKNPIAVRPIVSCCCGGPKESISQLIDLHLRPRVPQTKPPIKITKHIYPTQRYTSCSTRNAIYLLECTKCTKNNQYIGQTSRPLTTRLNEHRATSKTRTNLPLYKHFFQKVDHHFQRDGKVTILQVTTQKGLLEVEEKWIKLMDTVCPKGLKSQFHYYVRTTSCVQSKTDLLRQNTTTHLKIPPP